MRLTRNNITRFSKNPVNMDIPRTKFSMNSKHLTTSNSGKLIPFFFQECLPGDTFVMDTNFMLRMSTPVYPVADTAYFDYYYFFVPNRLVWSNWREFMGENPNGAWTTNKVTRRVPQMFATCESHSNSDYLGLPLSYDPYNRTCLPHRALRLIWNDWFRSTALQDPLLVNMGDTEPEYEVGPSNDDLLPVCRFPDFFSTCLPAPQYGEAVQIGLIDDLPISFGEKHDQYGSFMSLVDYNTGMSVTPQQYLATQLSDDATLNPYEQKVGMAGYGEAGTPDIGYNGLISIDNAYLKANNAVFTSVNDLRLAFQVQKYQEALARGGSRYVEIIQSLFNVQSPDARLQRPEYIGGGRQIVDMTQVVQTSATDANSTPQGNVSGLSKTMSSKHDFSYSCLEHGMIIGVCCVRPVHSYQQGLERYWFKRDTLDFYVPALANIGEQPVYVKELYFDPLDVSTYDDVFGYQEAWADYRYRRSYVSGDMRSNAPNGSLDAWHYADYYGIKPILSDTWIEESPTLIDRTLAVESSVADQFICDIYFNLSGVRPLPAYSIPGLIDHH